MENTTKITKIPVGIKSCVKNTHRKKSIENTWLKYLDFEKFLPVFLIGRKGQNSELIDNILYLDCDDSYPLLYTKTIAYFNWVYHNATSSHFWIVDDDSYINGNIFNNYKEYLNYDYSGNFIYGIDKTKDINGFASGSGYCLSRNAVKILLDNVNYEIIKIKEANKKFCEDVLVGDTLSIYMPDIKKLHIYNIYPWSYCKYYDNLMIGHYIHINSGLPFEDSMKKMHDYYQK